MLHVVTEALINLLHVHKGTLALQRISAVQPVVDCINKFLQGIANMASDPSAEVYYINVIL